MSPNKLVLTSFLTAITLAAPARATLVKAVTFDQKVEHADAIVLGRCTDTQTRWDDDHRFILTYAKFQVEQSVKGAPVREVTVVTPGGSIDGLHQSSVGITPFDKGDERVIFVKNTRLGPTVLYFDQGTYDVANDARGERVVTPVMAQSVRMDSQAGTIVPVEQPRSLRDFIGAVRESERRIDAVRMEMLERQRQAAAKPELGSVAARYWYLIALAVVGAALATWQILRK
jgi:hypothetical protein